MPEDHFVEGSGLRKEYKVGSGRIKALDGLDISIRKGEMVALMGPSGSGKTTLLNMLGGLDRPDAGSVRVGKVELGRLNEGQRAAFRKRNVGFIFQFFNLIPSLTALENVMVPVMFESGSGPERGEDLLRRVGLGERLDHLPGELSGGERQRVAIARALMNDPSMILADEPTGNIDSDTAREILGLFKEMNTEGKTLVIATHDRMVSARCSRVVRMRDGRVFAGKKKVPSDAESEVKA
jgi:putative ABC transport system ATP-binding protein